MQKAWNKMDRNYSVTRFEAELSIDELLNKYFDFEKTHKLCSACPGYAQTWACPPFDFEPEDFFRQYSVFHLIVDRIDNAGAADVEEAQQRLMEKIIVFFIVTDHIIMIALPGERIGADRHGFIDFLYGSIV